MAKVTPYLRTEWGVEWTKNRTFDFERLPFESALRAREYAAEWNEAYPEDPVKVVQRSISDWGDDE